MRCCASGEPGTLAVPFAFPAAKVYIRPLKHGLMDTNRRTFLKQAGLGAAAAYLAPAWLSCTQQRKTAGALTQIGLQLYTLRDQLAGDARATIARVAEIGYDHVETFGAEIGDDGKADFWGLSVAELKAVLAQHGLKTYSGHYVDNDFLTPGNGNEDLLKTYLDTAAELGQGYLVFPVPPIPLIDALTADDYRYMADQLNRAGELGAASGIKAGFHNHFWEFRTLADGSTGMDILLAHTDRDRVIFELDLFWSEKSGVDSAAFLRKYPGRFPLWHLKDIDPDNADTVTGPGYDDKPAMDIAATITYTEVGSGTIDFKAIVAEAQTAGLRYAFVEQDFITIDPFESIAKSYGYVTGELSG